jgi:multidrug efflux system membrane fusion protein
MQARAWLSWIVFAALPWVGCSSAGDASEAGKAALVRPQSSIPVTVAPVARKSMPIAATVVGTVEAFSTVSVHAQVTGELTSVDFVDGADVAKGQALFSLDRRGFTAALNQAEANLQRDIALAANATSQAERYRGLVERGIATREQLDQMRTTSAALDATIAADRAAVEAARIQLTYATIAAPISGRTGKLMVHTGNLVRSTDVAPLVVINQVSPIYVSFGLPESEFPGFRRYLAAHPLRVEAQAGQDDGPPSIGQVSFVDNAVDSATGTIEIRGTFPNADRRLWPGQFVNVLVTLGTEADALVVPGAAAQTGQQGTYVFVAKPDNTVELRPIQTVRTVGDEVVVKSGLSAGETVVTDGQVRLVPGSRISIRTAGLPEWAP